MFECSSQLYGLLSKRFYNCFDLRLLTVAVLLFCKLTVVKFVIESAFSEQLLVCALFNDVAVLHNKGRSVRSLSGKDMVIIYGRISKG